MVVISVWAVMTICVLALLLPVGAINYRFDDSYDQPSSSRRRRLRTHRYISTEPRTVISRPKLRNKYLDWNMGQQVDAPFGPTFG
ncbi:hypothetical protein KEM48_010707 [Puccinia striiformis f. sp. tritici PST-130]|nr:hypothetical protein Pst134EB_018795 [Puccinia striiformis f. sp. tritici]KAI9625754.1 hypothetical protein KEM48_010707 [Puccinia striiformis f. sp. tritici PST-130]